VRLFRYSNLHFRRQRRGRVKRAAIAKEITTPKLKREINHGEDGSNA
jgi:hypothetical protein